MKPKITYAEFEEIHNKLEIRIGRIVDVEKVPKSNGLKLTVVFNEDEFKTAFTNLGKYFAPEDLKGLICPFIMNLEPSEIKGVVSEVMIMVGEDIEGKIRLKDYHLGSKLM